MLFPPSINYRFEAIPKHSSETQNTISMLLISFQSIHLKLSYNFLSTSRMPYNPFKRCPQMRLIMYLCRLKEVDIRLPATHLPSTLPTVLNIFLYPNTKEEILAGTNPPEAVSTNTPFLQSDNSQKNNRIKSLFNPPLIPI